MAWDRANTGASRCRESVRGSGHTASGDAARESRARGRLPQSARDRVPPWDERVPPDGAAELGGRLTVAEGRIPLRRARLRGGAAREPITRRVGLGDPRAPRRDHGGCIGTVPPWGRACCPAGVARGGRRATGSPAQGATERWVARPESRPCHLSATADLRNKRRRCVHGSRGRLPGARCETPSPNAPYRKIVSLA